MKRLVVLFDGTWNKPGKEDEITNVVKLRRFIPDSDAHGVRQLVQYVIGIATEDLGRLTFAVGAIGLGVGDRIRRGYTFLCENYEDGDEIYLIGFSRGAFEARSLAGLIALAGVARSATPETVADVWDYYEQNKLEPDAARLQALRAAARYPVRIKCVGVWDTVGITGIPFLRKGAIKELLGISRHPAVAPGRRRAACARHRRAARAVRAHVLDHRQGRCAARRPDRRAGLVPRLACQCRRRHQGLARCPTSRCSGWRNG